MEDKIKIGVSACLLGEPVRYDGGHKTEFRSFYMSCYFLCEEQNLDFPVAVFLHFFPSFVLAAQFIFFAAFFFAAISPPLC